MAEERKTTRRKNLLEIGSLLGGLLGGAITYGIQKDAENKLSKQDPNKKNRGDKEVRPKESTLEIAKKVANELIAAGYEYGNNPTEDPNIKKLNCARFMFRVLQEIIPRQLSEDEKNLILIHHTVRGSLDRAVRRGDKSTRGCTAFVEEGGWGEPIKPEDAQPGDIVQYWYKTKKGGGWLGHTGIIASVERDEKGRPTARLLSSHKSTGGIGVAPYDLVLHPTYKKVYISRVNDNNT